MWVGELPGSLRAKPETGTVSVIPNVIVPNEASHKAKPNSRGQKVDSTS